MSRTARPIAEVTAALRALGVRPAVVLEVHTSYRAIGPVEGGPLGVLAALREAVGPRGTLVLPTMSAGDAPFDPATTPSLGMGVLAELFRTRAGVRRSTHPGASFAAEGPDAEAVCAPQPLEPPHGVDSPPGRVAARDGQVLLLGVRLSECTLLHVAEDLARVPYAVAHPCVVGDASDARTQDVYETDHCCEGFARLEPELRARGLLRSGPVGFGEARLAEARPLVEAVAALLRDDPLRVLCAAAAGCGECDRARASAFAPRRAPLALRV